MKRKSVPTQIVGYYRVSTQEQGIGGLGMAAQREAVARYAAATGLPIVARYEEVETGSKADLRNRPQLAAAVAHVRRSGALLVIARLDRLARNVYVTSQLLESGIDFVACDNPHASRLTIQILAAMAEHESQLISARVKAAMAAAREREVVFKNYSQLSPEGIRLGVEASRAARIRRTREAYADLVPLVHDLRAAGHSAKAISDRLNELGHTNQFGRLWAQGPVRKLLKREGLGHLQAQRKYENHLTGQIQAAGVAAHSVAARRRTRAYYEPHVPLLRDLCEAGLSSIAIARELNDRDIKTQGGSRWYSSIVFDVLRREGIAPAAVPGRRGLMLPNVQSEGRLRAALRISAIAASNRGRVMPIISWLRARGQTYREVASYLNSHGYVPAKAGNWTGASVASFVARDPARRKVGAPFLPE